MKKNYSKKQLASLIIEANPDAFIPFDTLVDDLDSIFKIRKIARKILDDNEYDEMLLKNLIITANNVFHNKAETLYNIVMSEQELDIIKDYL